MSYLYHICIFIYKTCHYIYIALTNPYIYNEVSLTEADLKQNYVGLADENMMRASQQSHPVFTLGLVAQYLLN